MYLHLLQHATHTFLGMLECMRVRARAPTHTHTCQGQTHERKNNRNENIKKQKKKNHFLSTASKPKRKTELKLTRQSAHSKIQTTTEPSRVWSIRQV